MLEVETACGFQHFLDTNRKLTETLLETTESSFCCSGNVLEAENMLPAF